MGRQDETQLTTKIDGFLSFALLMYCFASLKKKSGPCMTKLRVRLLCFTYSRDNSIGYALLIFKKKNKIINLFVILVKISLFEKQRNQFVRLVK
jgi:hypothetical protein